MSRNRAARTTHTVPDAAAGATRRRSRSLLEPALGANAWKRRRVASVHRGDGTRRAVSFRGVTPLDNDIYMVYFAGGSAEWRIGLTQDGKIGRLALGPQY